MEVAAASVISQIPGMTVGAGSNFVEPSSATIQQFEGLVQDGGQNEIVILPEESAAVPGQSSTIGDSILRGLEAMGSGMQVNADRLRMHLNQYGAVMDASNMLQVQMDVFMLSLQQDLTAKVADRASQGIQTLFRNQ